MAGSMWKQQSSAVTALLQSIQTSLLERKRAVQAIGLQQAQDRYDTQIQQSLSQLSKNIVELEHILSLAEQSQAEDASTLKKWEASLLEMNKQYERIENMWRQVAGGETKSLDIIKERQIKLAKQQQQREELLSSSSSQQKTVVEPSSQTTALNTNEHLQLQQQLMSDQDVQLDVLSQAIERQKQVGLAITNELESQIELLQETEDAVDRTQSRLHTTSRRLDRFFEERGWNSRGLCLIFILLILLALVISLARKH